MDLVTVASYTLQPEAHLAKNLLESEEIPAFLSEEIAGDMLHLNNEIKLMVASENAEKAREILAGVERHELTGEAAAEAEKSADNDAVE
jgi:Putative prokaryotic signal transducing protein